MNANSFVVVLSWWRVPPPPSPPNTRHLLSLKVDILSIKRLTVVCIVPFYPPKKNNSWKGKCNVCKQTYIYMFPNDGGIIMLASMHP